MKIAIIGAGGVGGLFGAALQRAGQDVRFLARGPHLAAMRERGLRIRGAHGEYHLGRVHATEDPGELGTVDVALFAVKLWDVEETARTLAPVIGEDTIVITLQNGIDAPQQLATIVGAGHVAAGSCFVNAAIIQPGVILQRSESQGIVAGMLSGTRSPVLEAFETTCHAADIDVEITAAPLEVLWEKFIQLVPSSAMTTLLRRPIGAVREDSESWTLFLRLLDETVTVGRATGVRIPPEVIERRLAYVRRMPYGATASMAIDLTQGRRLELPWLSGRISDLGRRHGIPTPANDFVTIALKPFAYGNQFQPVRRVALHAVAQHEQACGDT